MNMDKWCVFATLWQVWHGNTFETYANFEIICFLFLFQMHYRRMFCHKLGSKRRFGFLGAKEASGRKLPIPFSTGFPLPSLLPLDLLCPLSGLAPSDRPVPSGAVECSHELVDVVSLKVSDVECHCSVGFLLEWDQALPLLYLLVFA